MYYSSRRGSTTKKQTSVLKTSTTRFEDGSPSGNDTDGGSAELLDLSTSREDLSRAPSRCSCQSGESSNTKNDTKDGVNRSWSGANLKLEFDNNGASDDELLKEELLRIFDRERLGLESYFKHKTESILQGYRRKQCEWEENLRLEKIEYEKRLTQEKIEVQQNYISEMTKLTKQFNQERVELESHYKKQISELSQQFEMRKKDMDETIIKERTELKQRLEMEYQSMLKTQRTSDEQRFLQQRSELEEGYRKKILDLEQKLKEAFSESELSGRKIQSDLEARFERERAVLVVEWKKRVELLELELGKEKERANKEERKACESQGFLRTEITKKEVEIERLRQVVETLKVEISKKEKTAKEFEMLQQSIFLRGSDALPGKLREDFEKMLASHREELGRSFRKEREGLEMERERRTVMERETLEKQLRMERERMAFEMEKERNEIRRAERDKENDLREELKKEVERMKTALETEKAILREQVKDELGKERTQIGEKILQEKDEREREMVKHLKGALDSLEEEGRKGLERREYEVWVANRASENKKGTLEDKRRSAAKDRSNDILCKNESRSEKHGHVEKLSDVQVNKYSKVDHGDVVEEKSTTNVTFHVDNKKTGEYSLRVLEQENEGLKAKVDALQENIKLHECYKTEASEEIERLRKMNKDLKVKMQETKEKLKDYEEHLNESEEKIKEYEEICIDYEKYLHDYREKIFVVEKNREMSIVARAGEDEGEERAYPGIKQDDHENFKNKEQRGTRASLKSREKAEYEEGEDDEMERSKRKGNQTQSKEDSIMVDILRMEKNKLERIIHDLEDKIRLLEKKISEISIAAGKDDSRVDVEQRRALAANLERVRKQNRELVNKVKDLQLQLQGLVDKLRKEKKKVTFLQTEYRSFKSMHQLEMKELLEKLEHSGNVIARLQSASAESDTVGRLQEEISAISKLVMEERLNDRRMIRARSAEEVEKLRELDREKDELERKLRDARIALDGYSERLKNKVAYAEMVSSQHSLNSGSNVLIQDMRLSKTIQALEESKKTSLRQNERLLHEKKALQSLIGRLCKSPEELHSFRGSKLSISFHSSSTSSLSSSSSSVAFLDNGRASSCGSNKFSNTFSVFD